MQGVERVFEREVVPEYTDLIASVGKHFLMTELEPMLEAIARAALPLLGDLLVLDAEEGGVSRRLFEFRRDSRTWIEGPHRLGSISHPEICTDGHCSRLSVPVFGKSLRIGTLSLGSRQPIYGCAEMNVLEEIAVSLGLAIENIWTHDALVEAVDARDRLISIAAHELRGSTCSLRICTQALRSAATPLPAKGARLVRIVEREERRLSHMIDELFDLGRIESGQVELKVESVDLCEVVREVVARLTDQDPGVLGRIELDLPAEAKGQWDRFRVDQIVRNLLTNALKFGGDQPIRVRIKTETGRGKVSLEVVDRGPGIDPAIQAVIFEPFKRDRSVGRDGLGLGLYIVQNVVHALGGEIRVASTLGCGATFSVDLPARLLVG
ncbi:MAG TPA: HAMP domain-containing sensor histidine kinase [Polyangia bacterium]|nr:HAMP domain-containing sensor histidine kinase [Polyangia bacterium]